MSFLIPKKPQILYAPMLSSFGGGSARGFNPGGGGVEPLDVDTVFSIQTYNGNGGSQTISLTNSIAPNLILSKARSAANYQDNHLNDTTRGATKVLITNGTTGQMTYPNALTSIGNGSYQMSDITYNQSSNSYFSYAFKKNERFFDIVTYTGTGSAQTISHSLNQEVGMIWVKRTDASEDWGVYHRYLGATKRMFLNTRGSVQTSSVDWNNTSPTETAFTVGTANHVNANGGSYIAYLFAHEEGPTGAIACGGFTNGTSSVNLGFEPEMLMIKSTTDGSAYTGSWRYTDQTRGGLTAGDSPYVMLDEGDQEQTSAFGNIAEATSTGFNIRSQGDYGTSSIYWAIKKGS